MNRLYIELALGGRKMENEELTIKLSLNDASYLLDAIGKALGQPGLKMTIDDDYINSCNAIIDKLNDAINNLMVGD